MTNNFCFGTLAVGKRYRCHARLLAEDIGQYAPAKKLVILTDKVNNFIEYAHVIPVKHHLQSVKGYHDKRFVIATVLNLFDTCIFLDADVRIIGDVPSMMNFSPGITARTGCNILKHNQGENKNKSLKLIQEIAPKLNIELANTKWFHEFMFAVTKQEGKEVEFLKVWQTISYFFETQGIYDGEGNVMGLAAAKVGLTVGLEKQDSFPFFKDNIEQVRIKNGQSILTEKQQYFDIQRSIEYPKNTLWQKVINLLINKTRLFYRLIRLKIKILSDEEFQSLFNNEKEYQL